MGREPCGVSRVSTPSCYIFSWRSRRSRGSVLSERTQRAVMAARRRTSSCLSSCAGEGWEETMSELEDVIRATIIREGPIPFVHFMGLALYHPTLGYYTGGGRGREPLGWEGDYITSGDLHPLWGWALARQLQQMWELLGRPVPFDVLEPGAGRGLLAREVWRYARRRAPDWFAALRYTLVDRAPSDAPLRAMRERQLREALAALDAPLEATRSAGTIAEIFPPSTLTGVVVSNELLDALPTHVVQISEGALQEVYVAADA